MSVACGVRQHSPLHSGGGDPELDAVLQQEGGAAGGAGVHGAGADHGEQTVSPPNTQMLFLETQPQVPNPHKTLEDAGELVWQSAPAGCWNMPYLDHSCNVLSLCSFVTSICLFDSI